MAENLLFPEEQTTFAAGLERLQVERMGAETHERLRPSMHKLAAELASRWPWIPAGSFFNQSCAFASVVRGRDFAA